MENEAHFESRQPASPTPNFSAARMGNDPYFESQSHTVSVLERLGDSERAKTLLLQLLGQAREAKSEVYVLLFEARLARLEGEMVKALGLLQQAYRAHPKSDAILASFADFMNEILAGDRERQIRLDAWRSLSARAAHRIDNQLFVSQGALRTLKDAHDPKVAEAVADLEASRATIHRIIREFQRFSKNEPPVLGPTQLGPLVNQTVERVAQVAGEVQVSAEVEEPLPACLLDARQFGEALGELLENALHHTQPGGQVRVTAKAVPSPDSPRVRVAVEDTGSGVAAADKERIFEPFFSRRPGGTGLGLAIVKQIVENHGGTIRETGQEGSGARFEIELPARVEEETAHESPGS